MNKNLHTVEKIGGTSMTRFGELMQNILIGSRQGSELYNRIFVVSAYGGVTNLLLEDKKTGEPGIYGSFAAGDNRAWQEKLEATRQRMIELNHSFADLKLDLKSADAFVDERMNGVKNCLLHLMHLRSFGHFQPGNYLPAARELLSSIGEAHSAFNSALILKEHGVIAVFVDLSGWKDQETGSMEETIAVVKAAAPDCKVMVGGAVLTPEFAERIGADYYCKDAMKSVEAANEVFA
jgi:aspartate kinase